MQQVIDDVREHFQNNFPEELPVENAYLPIGVFLAWVIEQELYSSFFEDEFETQILRFKRHETCCGILAELWDGYVAEEQLNEEGKKFAQYYYGNGIYLKDFQETLGKNLPSIYYVADNWQNYNRMRCRIDERFYDWKFMSQY
ncbi:hypothetical protein AAG747_13860 [Rapidithrix thailandica]|uniref:DUF7832 domain-containing protein n=1 Tax=Rapidithrix thailandica TaxID=413964 RepID=A0AAW9S9H1_9BACT